MNPRLIPLVTAGIGAGIMYLFDPERGRRRRALIRDKTIHTVRATTDAINTASQDFSNRARGVPSRMRSWWSPEEVSDDVLIQRVRAQIGRVVSHPRSLEISAQNGHVALHGPVFADEVDHLMRRVYATRGVKSVENALEVHEHGENVPGLQGQGRVITPMRSFERQSGSPGLRAAAALAGGVLTVYAARRRGAARALASSAGLALLARAVGGADLRRLTGLAGRRGIDVRKSININAPVERVFELWSQFENFPHFMSNVREVRKVGEQHSHWTVAGPAGTTVEWNAITTRYEPNRAIAWKTEPGSPVQHAGTVNFTSNPDGSTRVDVRLSYNPVAGAIGHAVASLFGADPESEMHQDLMRMKTFVETGRAPRDAAAAQPGIYH